MKWKTGKREAESGKERMKEEGKVKVKGRGAEPESALGWGSRPGLAGEVGPGFLRWGRWRGNRTS